MKDHQQIMRIKNKLALFDSPGFYQLLGDLAGDLGMAGINMMHQANGLKRRYMDELDKLDQLESSSSLSLKWKQGRIDYDNQ